MNTLLEKLRDEVVDLRQQTVGLTKQMWLLYVTFEDFICIHHPYRSKNLIETSINIDNYINGPLLKSPKRRSQIIFQSYKFDHRAEVTSHVSGTTNSSRRQIKGTCSCDESDDTGSWDYINKQTTNSQTQGYLRDEVLNNKGLGQGYGLGQRSSGHSITMRSVSEKRHVGKARGQVVSEPHRHSLDSHGSFSRNSTRMLEAVTEDRRSQTFAFRPTELTAESDSHRQHRQHHAQLERISNKRLNLPSQSSSQSLPTGNLQKKVSRETDIPEMQKRQCIYLSEAGQRRSTGEIDNLSTTRSGYRDMKQQLLESPALYQQNSVRRSDMRADNTQLSPVTISSGYESDYVPSPLHLEMEKIPGILEDSKKTKTETRNYFSQSDIYPQSEVLKYSPKKDVHPFGTYQDPRKKSTGKPNYNTLELFCLPREKGTQFSKVQRQSHKLNKVTRSMYEIIDDLQRENSVRKSRRQQRHSDDRKGCMRKQKGRVTFSPILTSELEARNDVPARQSESEAYLPMSSPRHNKQSTDNITAQPDSTGDFYSKVSPVSERFKQNNEPQSNLTTVTQNWPSSEIICQEKLREKTIKTLDQLGDISCFRDDNAGSAVRRETTPDVMWKFPRGTEAHSDNEHIYEVIPGDEHILQGETVQPLVESPKLAKWSTLANLPTVLSGHPPALPERRYTRSPRMASPLPQPPTTMNSAKFERVNSPCVKSHQNQLQGDQTKICAISSKDISLYSVVRKTPIRTDSPFSNRLDIEAIENSDSETDTLYSKVLPVKQRARHSKMPASDYEDISSETYYRLESVKGVEDLGHWSAADMLNFIDGIRGQNIPKRRENIYHLLGNSKTRAKFSESLEIETRLLDKGLIFNSWMEDASPSRFICDVRHMEPTFV